MELSMELGAMSHLVAAADAHACRCEATLAASWPLAADAAQIKRLMGGAVVRISMPAPAAGGLATTTFHVVPASGIDEHGVISRLVPTPTGVVAFTRLALNAVIDGVCSSVVSERNADGTIVPGGPQLTSMGFPVAVTTEGNGTLCISYDGPLPDVTLALDAGALSVLERHGVAGGLLLKPWVGTASAPRGVVRADLARVATVLSRLASGHTAVIALTAMGMTPPGAAGADARAVFELAGMTAAMAGVRADAGAMSRLMAASVNAPAGGVFSCYDREACAAGVTLLEAVASILHGCTGSGVAMSVATEMAPRAGVGTLPASVRAPIVGAKIREAIGIIAARGPAHRVDPHTGGAASGGGAGGSHGIAGGALPGGGSGAGGMGGAGGGFGPGAGGTAGAG